MKTIYGYARCSTSEQKQDIDRQKRDLLQLGVSNDKHIYWEYESGTKTDRPELEKLLSLDCFILLKSRDLSIISYARSLTIN